MLALLLPAFVGAATRGTTVFNADTTGRVDISAAMNAAVASSSHLVIPPGRYLLGGAATVALSDVDIECQGAPANANTTPEYGHSGATFLLTSRTQQPFMVGAGVSIRNCNFFWPDQTGKTTEPLVYPPLFTERPRSQMTNFDLVGDRIVNAYDVLAASDTNDAFGAITLTDTVGYAIRYWLSLANVPETVTIKGMMADWSLHQHVANAGNRNLVNWTAAHGAFLHVFGDGKDGAASTVSVQGIVYDGSVFAYNKFIWVDATGTLSESTFSGIIDAVPHALQVDAGGCAANIKIDALVYSYQWGGGGKDNSPAFSIGSAPDKGCTTTGIDIGGQLAIAQGDVIDIEGNGIKTVSLHMNGNGTYAASTTKANYNFANIDSPTVIFTSLGNYVQPAISDPLKQGFLIRNCYLCVLDANAFNGVFNPVSVNSPAIPIVGSGNISVASPIGSAIVGTGRYVNRLQIDNAWDIVGAPALPASQRN